MPATERESEFTVGCQVVIYDKKSNRPYGRVLTVTKITPSGSVRTNDGRLYDKAGFPIQGGITPIRKATQADLDYIETQNQRTAKMIADANARQAKMQELNALLPARLHVSGGNVTNLYQIDGLTEEEIRMIADRAGLNRD